MMSYLPHAPKRTCGRVEYKSALRVVERGVWVVAINKEDPIFLCCPSPELPALFTNLMEEREEEDDDDNKVITCLLEEER